MFILKVRIPGHQEKGNNTYSMFILKGRIFGHQNKKENNIAGSFLKSGLINTKITADSFLKTPGRPKVAIYISKLMKLSFCQVKDQAPRL